MSISGLFSPKSMPIPYKRKEKCFFLCLPLPKILSLSSNVRLESCILRFCRNFLGIWYVFLKHLHIRKKWLPPPQIAYNWRLLQDILGFIQKSDSEFFFFLFFSFLRGPEGRGINSERVSDEFCALRNFPNYRETQPFQLCQCLGKTFVDLEKVPTKA